MKTLTYPYDEKQVRALKAGDAVSVTGRIYTGRDKFHKYFADGGELPVDFRDGALYHCGPVIVQAAGRAGQRSNGYQVRAAGPTTSVRENPYEPDFIAKSGVRVIIGKGGMDANTLAAMKRHGCVYVQAVGGAAAVSAAAVKRVAGVSLLDEFGAAEACWHFDVEDFRGVVAMDAHGVSLFDRVRQTSERLRSALVRLSAFAAVFAALTAGAAPKAQDPARIAEIEAALRDAPEICTPRRFVAVAKGKDLVRVVRAAEKIAAQAVPAWPDDLYLDFTRNGNRTRYQDWCERFVKDVDQLVEAERGENKGRFLSALAARLDALATWKSWTLPAHDASLGNYDNTYIHIDLRSALLSRYLGEILVAFGDRLPPKTVTHVRDEVKRRVFEPYLATARVTDFRKKNWQRRNWWFFGGNNWNAVCHSECVRGALALIADKRTRAEFVEAAERGLDDYFEGFPPDGYCSEGMGYWNYGYGNFLEMGLAVRKATNGKVDFFSHERAYAAMRFPLQFQLQKNISPHFADGGGNPYRGYVELGCQVWPELKAEADGALPIRSAFSDGQVWFARLPSDAKRSFALACKGGHNDEQHNHNDIGSWTVMLDGLEVAGDPGGEIYTRRTFSKDRYRSDVLNSFGHPVPRVSGTLQPAGRKWSAKVVSTAFTDGRDTVTLDLTGAYDCKSLTSLVRTFVFDRTAQQVTISDRVAFSAPAAFDDPLITFAEVKSDYVPEKLSLVASKNVVADVVVAAKGADGAKPVAWSWQKRLLDNPQKESPKRLAVAFDKPVTSAEVAFTFSIPR